MRARLLLKQRLPLAEHEFAEMLVWEVPEAVRGSDHSFKYSLAYVVRGRCVVRFDNESGKGDHCHIGDKEYAVDFVGLDELLECFWQRVEAMRGERHEDPDD